MSNSVLLGLSSRRRKRLCVNYTNNRSLATILRCGRIRASPTSVTLGIALGKLHNNRSKLRVGRKHTGTGGLVTHFVGRIVACSRTYLIS